MKTLTPKQRKELKALAHHLTPVVLIGKQGFTEGLCTEVKQALLSHELIKVKFNDHKTERLAISETVATATESALVATLGNISIFFKPHPDPSLRKIKGI